MATETQIEAEAETETWQIAYTVNGETEERLYEGREHAKARYDAAVKSKHYDALSLEQYKDGSFVSVEDWRREHA